MSRTDHVFRVIAAPAASLYAAFVHPQALAQWLPPEGMTGRVETFEARAGGTYRIVFTHDEASNDGESSDVIEGVFVELIPDSRVVQRVMFESDDPSLAGAMTISWRFDPVDEGTRVTVTCEGVPVGIRKKDHLDGLRSTLANLAAFVE